jgi:serine/threonine protein kinase
MSTGSGSGSGSQDGSPIGSPLSIYEHTVGAVIQDLKMSMDDFDLLAVIGKGSFGKVLQVRKKATGEIFALKILKKKQLAARNQVEHTKTERRVLQSIRHPFVVRLHGAFQTPNKLYMVMDFIGGGELFFHLKKEGRFSEERVMFYVAELVLAIEHLHKHGVVYRDLKPENILIQFDGHLCVTDFGLSKQLHRDVTDQTHTFCGTPEYLAPEVLQGGGHGTVLCSLPCLDFSDLSFVPIGSDMMFVLFPSA